MSDKPEKRISQWDWFLVGGMGRPPTEANFARMVSKRAAANRKAEDLKEEKRREKEANKEANRKEKEKEKEKDMLKTGAEEFRARYGKVDMLDPLFLDPMKRVDKKPYSEKEIGAGPGLEKEPGSEKAPDCEEHKSEKEPESEKEPGSQA